MIWWAVIIAIVLAVIFVRKKMGINTQKPGERWDLLDSRDCPKGRGSIRLFKSNEGKAVVQMVPKGTEGTLVWRYTSEEKARKVYAGVRL